MQRGLLPVSQILTSPRTAASASATLSKRLVSSGASISSSDRHASYQSSARSRPASARSVLAFTSLPTCHRLPSVEGSPPSRRHFSLSRATMSAPRSEGKANPHRAISHNHSSTIFPLADIEQWIHPQDPDFIKEAKRTLDVEDYTYTERDVILYNIGVGASAKDLKYVYEGHENFGAVPTFGVIPSFITSFGMRLDFLPGYSHLKLLHGEQYLKICAPIPTSGTLTTESRIVEVLDKGKAASVTMYTTTKDQEGTLVFENYSLLFVRGSGGFGGQKTGSDRGPVTALNKLPDRPADVVVEQKTSTDQAAIYRLSGDYNPLHIDPAASKVGGFDKPIIHGLCFFGIAGRHVVDTYGPIKEIKVRFAGSLFPGETVCTHLWRDGDKVTFVSKCKERDVIILSAAAATLA